MSEDSDAAERLAEHLVPFFHRLEDEGGSTLSAEEHAALTQTSDAETIDNLSQALYAAIDHYVEMDFEGWHGVVWFYEVEPLSALTAKARRVEMEGYNITDRVLALLDALDAEENPEDRKRR